VTQRLRARDLAWGLLVVAVMLGIAGFVHFRQLANVPSAVPPPQGETLTGDAALRLHPRVEPPVFDASRFARLPDTCGCELASGRAQLLMFVNGSQQAIDDRGMATYVVHEVAVARAVDGGERAAAFPALDGVAPGRRTEGFAARFDVACAGDRMLIVDAVHATLWDLARMEYPRRLWSTALPVRRGDVERGTSLRIDCFAATIEGDLAIVEPALEESLRLRLADGTIEPALAR
jgi:hypothetical protein